LDVSNVVTVSKTEFNEYLTEKPMPPLDGTLIRGDEEATVFLVQETKKRPISYPVFVQHKFSFANVVALPQDEVDDYDTGAFVTPTNGTLVVGSADATVYFIDGDLKRPVSYEVFLARKFSFGTVMQLSD